MSNNKKNKKKVKPVEKHFNMEDIDITKITFLCKSYSDLSKDELLEALSDLCKPVQIGIIMDHIDLLEDAFMIGYHNTEERVFILDDDNGLMEIRKHE